MLTLEQKLKVLEDFIKNNHYTDTTWDNKEVVKCSYIEGTELLVVDDLSKDEQEYIKGLIEGL